MDLLEYQAKELFHQVGIPILPSQPIKTVGELKWLSIPYPIVLKSQVRVGGRGKAGGIRFVENTIDAIAAASAIFNLPINREYPEVILAEAEYNVQEELFLCVLLDYDLQRPVLLGSARGGMDTESFLDQMQEVVIDQDFFPFYARRLALKMGLKGELIKIVSEIIEKMYHLFLEKDLDYIEINPLALNTDGEVMALDGKISVNETALARHAEIMTLTSLDSETPSPIVTYPKQVKTSKNLGKIAIISNSEGLGFAAWDSFRQQQENPYACYIINERECQLYLRQQLTELLTQLTENSAIKVIFVNWLSSPLMTQSVCQSISDHLISLGRQPQTPSTEERTMRATGFGGHKRSNNPTLSPKNANETFFPVFIVRLMGAEANHYQQELTPLSVIWANHLEDGTTQAVKLLKSL